MVRGAHHSLAMPKASSIRELERAINRRCSDSERMSAAPRRTGLFL